LAIDLHTSRYSWPRWKAQNGTKRAVAYPGTCNSPVRYRSSYLMRFRRSIFPFELPQVSMIFWQWPNNTVDVRVPAHRRFYFVIPRSTPDATSKGSFGLQSLLWGLRDRSYADLLRSILFLKSGTTNYTTETEDAPSLTLRQIRLIIVRGCGKSYNLITLEETAAVRANSRSLY
jgi:hypothetical protein